MTKFYLLFILSYLFSSVHSLALDIDEQLTVRLLKTSQSKKTILVNRGSEENLNEGDHAKFFLTEGVVARGVAVEVAPHRSIWALYRLVNPVLIAEGQVLDLKITEELPLSDDETRSIFSGEADLATGTGAILRDLPSSISPSAQVGLRQDSETKTSTSRMIAPTSEKKRFSPFELLAAVSYQRMSGTVIGDNESSYTGTEGHFHMNLGLEIYFKYFSLTGYYGYHQGAELAYEGALIESMHSEYGVMGKLYFTADPRYSNEFYPYLKAGVGMGSIKNSFAGGERSVTASGTSTAEGATRSFTMGLGGKYTTAIGLSVFAELDYYIRRDRFDEEPETAGILWDKELSGPRMSAWFGCRF